MYDPDLYVPSFKHLYLTLPVLTGEGRETWPTRLAKLFFFSFERILTFLLLLFTYLASRNFITILEKCCTEVYSNDDEVIHFRGKNLPKKHFRVGQEAQAMGD